MNSGWFPQLASPQCAEFCPLVTARDTNKRLENPDFAEASRQNSAQPQAGSQGPRLIGNQLSFGVVKVTALAAKSVSE